MLWSLGWILWAFNREVMCSNVPFRKVTRTALCRIGYDVKARWQMGGCRCSPQGRDDETSTVLARSMCIPEGTAVTGNGVK